jgi:hypothetical protein
MNEATFEARLNAELQRIFPTLTKLNVSHQDIFTLHFGRKLITINGKENDKVFGRYDVLIEIEGKPLILFELKRPGIDLFAEDRDQGISYARLLDPMPPLVIVSNGQKTEFYTTCDKKPWVTNSYDENALRALVEHALSAAAAEKDESVRLLLGQQPKIWTDIIRQFTSDKLIGRQGDDSVVVVFGLDEGDGNVGLVVENVVGTLGLAAGYQSAADDDPAFCERNLFANLRQDIPARLLDSGRDELSTDVAFAEAFLIL